MEMIISIFLALSVVINILLVISSSRLHIKYQGLKLKYDLLGTAYNELYLQEAEEAEDSGDDDADTGTEDGHEIAKPYSGFDL